MVEEEFNKLLCWIKKIGVSSFNLVSYICWIFIYIILIIGALSSIILVISKYPEFALKILPRILIIFQILSFFAVIFLAVAFWAFIYYVIIKKWGIPYLIRKREINLKKREEFKKELVESIIKEVGYGRRRHNNPTITK